MVEALIMGAAIRPRPVFVKVFPVIPARSQSKRTRNDPLGQITGLHWAGTSR